MTQRPVLLAPVDLALLRALQDRASLVAAADEVGISRDRAVYRLKRMARLAGGPVVRARRGGAIHGTSRLTALGERLGSRRTDWFDAGRATSAATGLRPTVVAGTFERRPEPRLVLDGGGELVVAFTARSGSRVHAVVEPDAIVLAARRFPSSVRNVLPGRVRHVGAPDAAGRAIVAVDASGQRFRCAVTRRSVGALGLRPGRPIVLMIKATAIRRREGLPATRGSLRS